MRKYIAILAISALLPITGSAAAQDLPGWSTTASCAAGDSSCAFFEADARGRVSGVWDTLPPDVRSKCASDTGNFEKSYRLLYDCLANAMQQLITGQVRGPGGEKVVNLTPPAKTPAPAAPAAQPQTEAAPSTPTQAAPQQQ